MPGSTYHVVPASRPCFDPVGSFPLSCKLCKRDKLGTTSVTFISWFVYLLNTTHQCIHLQPSISTVPCQRIKQITLIYLIHSCYVSAMSPLGPCVAGQVATRRSGTASATIRSWTCFLIRNSAVYCRPYWRMEVIIYWAGSDSGVNTSMRYQTYHLTRGNGQQGTWFSRAMRVTTSGNPRYQLWETGAVARPSEIYTRSTCVTLIRDIVLNVCHRVGKGTCRLA